MKKLTSLLIGCSLALAGAALAQQPVEQQSPSKGKRAPEKAHATQAAVTIKGQARPGKSARDSSTTRREHSEASGEASETNRSDEGTRPDK